MQYANNTMPAHQIPPNTNKFGEPSSSLIKLETPAASAVDSLSALDTSIDSVIHNVASTSAAYTSAVGGGFDSGTNGGGAVMVSLVSADQLPSTLLDAQVIVERIFELMPDCEGLEPDVIELISNVSKKEGF